LKEKMVKMPIPRSPAARTVRRSASTPRRCPSLRGRPRAEAQRPLPSMMMATCRGTTNPSIPALGSGCGFDMIPRPSHRKDFLFLGHEHAVDLEDRLVGRLLHLLGGALAVVLADLVILFQLLEHFKTVAPHMPHRDPRRLGIFMSDLDQFAAPLLVELRDAQPYHLPLGRGIEPEVRGLDRLSYGIHHGLVPDLDGNHTRLGHADGGDLVERHVRAIGLDLHRFEQARRRPPRAQPPEFVLERRDCALHASLDVVDIMCCACHGDPLESRPVEACDRFAKLTQPTRFGQSEACTIAQEPTSVPRPRPRSTASIAPWSRI